MQPAWKRPVYLLSAMVLWGMLASMVWIFFGVSRDSATMIDKYFWVCLGGGVILGFFIGRLWFRIVYIDGRRWHHIRLH